MLFFRSLPRAAMLIVGDLYQNFMLLSSILCEIREKECVRGANHRAQKLLDYCSQTHGRPCIYVYYGYNGEGNAARQQGRGSGFDCTSSPKAAVPTTKWESALGSDSADFTSFVFCSPCFLLRCDTFQPPSHRRAPYLQSAPFCLSNFFALS